MSSNEIGADIVFAGDESDTLFINAVKHDPETVEIIKNFSHMLGSEGEEFLHSPAVSDAEPVDMENLVFTEEETFDLDQVIAAASDTDAVPASSFSVEESIPEIAENAVDLDRIFDVMQITAATPTDNVAVFNMSADAPRESVLLDSSDLPASVFDSLDPSAGIDDIFKKLVLADES